jgi:hypothetical protein
MADPGNQTGLHADFEVQGSKFKVQGCGECRVLIRLTASSGLTGKVFQETQVFFTNPPPSPSPPPSPLP